MSQAPRTLGGVGITHTTGEAEGTLHEGGVDMSGNRTLCSTSLTSALWGDQNLKTRCNAL